MPPNHLFLCAFHASKEAQARAAEMAGREVSQCFSGGYVSACDLSTARARLRRCRPWRNKTQNRRHPRLPRPNISQTIHLAENEYINTFGTDHWRDTVPSPTNSRGRNRSNQEIRPQLTKTVPPMPER
jgi:hypothetical protein